MPIQDFRSGTELYEWFVAQIEDPELLEAIKDMCDLLTTFGTWEPKSPTMRSIEDQKKREEFFAALQDVEKAVVTFSGEPLCGKAFGPEGGEYFCNGARGHSGNCAYNSRLPTVDHDVKTLTWKTRDIPDMRCGEVIPGTSPLRFCNKDEGHRGLHSWNAARDAVVEDWRKAVKFVPQRGRQFEPVHLIGEADPELERLLAEEEEIERRLGRNWDATPPRAPMFPNNTGNTVLPPMEPKKLPPMAAAEDDDYEYDDDYDEDWLEPVIEKDPPKIFDD